MAFESAPNSANSNSARPNSDGLVLLNKPPGLTSFAALGAVKRGLGTRKVGHAGTLDKFATGLLVVMCGRLTRLVSLVMACPKTYTATIRFGVQTSTLDPEGEVAQTGPVPEERTLRAALPQFLGKLQQVPPDFSAIKIRGRRASDLVRAGSALRLQPRTVTVRQLELIEYQPPDLRVRLTCSKGFYVRSLARDLGQACGSCGHVVELNRTAIGEFQVTDAVSAVGFTREHLVEPAIVVTKLPGLGRCQVAAEARQRLLNGQPPSGDFFVAPPPTEGVWAAVDQSGAVLAILESTAGTLSYRCVLAS